MNLQPQYSLIDMTTIRTLRAVLDDGLDELFHDLLAEVPRRIDALLLAARTRDSVRLAELAHDLKGMAANLGATAIAENARLLEMMSRNSDPGAILAHIAAIETTYLQTRNEIKGILRNRPDAA